MRIQHQRPWDVATFPLGSPLTITAKHSDEDPDDSAGHSTLEDETGELTGDEAQDELDETEKKHADEDEAKGEEGEDDGKPKRFASHEAAEEGYRELQGHNSRVERELQLLRRQQTQKSSDPAEKSAVGTDFNEAALANAIAEAVDAEISALPKDKQHLQATIAATAREVLKTIKPMVAKVADESARAASAQSMSQEQVRAQATLNAEKALKEAGLTKPEHMELLVLERDRRRAADPDGWDTWTRTTKPEDQFRDLAQGVVKFVRSIGGATSDEVKDANRKHREDADTLDSGTRRSTRSTTKSTDDDTDGGSMLDALAADRKGAFDRSRRASQHASAGRR